MHSPPPSSPLFKSSIPGDETTDITTATTAATSVNNASLTTTEGSDVVTVHTESNLLAVILSVSVIPLIAVLIIVFLGVLKLRSQKIRNSAGDVVQDLNRSTGMQDHTHGSLGGRGVPMLVQVNPAIFSWSNNYWSSKKVGEPLLIVV